LASPGPAAYDLPASFSPAIKPAHPVVFGPHIIQPNSLRVAQHFIQTQHPFVEKFKQHQAKLRGEDSRTDLPDEADADAGEDGEPSDE
jgi:tRNA G37 N-methylase TrmD